MRLKNTIVYLMLLFLLAATLSGCGSKPAAKYIRYALGAEPETVDPRKSSGSTEFDVEAQIFEGLTGVDAKNNPVPAAAERWEVSADGLTYTFFLRKNAKWSNGDPVTANDFEYSWKTELNQELGSRYAYQLYYLKNGEAYNKGQAKADDVGVKAVDDYTLKVTLEQPTAYFISLTSLFTYYPVHKATVETNPNWAADPKTIIGNGPFKMVSWTHNSKIEFVKNEHYWDAAKVKMSKLEFFLIENSNTELSMFDNKQIDMGSNPPVADYDRLRAEGNLKTAPLLSTYYYCFNVTKPPFNNPKVRKALTLAIDRKSIVTNVTKAGQKPALAWVPFGLGDANPNDDFRTVGGDYYKDNDIEIAKRLLAEAGYPDGKGLPPITLIYNTSEGHKAIAEAIQEMWKKNLGISVALTNQEWKVFINTRVKGDYQVARHGWVGDYSDPMTFIDLFTPDSGNNDSKYNNPVFNALVRKAKTSNDQAVRMQAMHDAEKILMDDAVIAPIYFYTSVTMVRPYVKGYLKASLGQLYFKEAYIE